MKGKVTIEYDIPFEALTLQQLRDREEQRWMAIETLLGLRTATVKVELIHEPG
ncbi:MAG TPA: hypothetical protein VKC66_29915 [Xanthobacteraceae bacterium]|nr:hypothetical protein [Xanthobacteraceae bacterium]